MWDITGTAEASYLLSDLAVSFRSGWYLWYGLWSVWWAQAGLVFQAVWTRASLIRLLWAFGLASYKAIVAAGQDILCTPIADRGNRSEEERQTDRQTRWQKTQYCGNCFPAQNIFSVRGGCWLMVIAYVIGWSRWSRLLCIISKFILKVKVILLYCRLL